MPVTHHCRAHQGKTQRMRCHAHHDCRQHQDEWQRVRIQDVATTLRDDRCGSSRHLRHGHVELDGKLLSDMNDGELVKLRRNKLGFIFQSFGLISLLSAYENVQLPLHISGTSWRERRRRATSALDMVGLAGRANHRPYELSGGEQQRVAIARALVSEPSILFADEPTGELDSVNAMYISQILKDISKTNQVTIIAATHDPTLADMCDEVYRMQDGAILD